jgi:hypothetical protein
MPAWLRSLYESLQQRAGITAENNRGTLPRLNLKIKAVL